jgi:acyl carrier protein
MSSDENDTTFARVRRILSDEFAVARERIEPDVRMDQLAIDSLAVIEVMFRLEEEFKITFTQDPAQWSEELKTVGDLAAAIDRLVSESKPAAEPAETP